MSPEDTIGMIGKAIADLICAETAAPRRAAAFAALEKPAEEARIVRKELDGKLMEEAQTVPEDSGAVAAKIEKAYTPPAKEEFSQGIGLDQHFSFLSPDEEIKQKIPFVYGNVGGAGPVVESAKIVKPVSITDEERIQKPNGHSKPYIPDDGPIPKPVSRNNVPEPVKTSAGSAC